MGVVSKKKKCVNKPKPLPNMDYAYAECDRYNGNRIVNMTVVCDWEGRSRSLRTLGKWLLRAADWIEDGNK